MADYSFLTLWQLDAPIGRVWDVIVDVERYPIWWKYVVQVAVLSPGDAHRLGRVARHSWTTALRFPLHFDELVTGIEAPWLIETAASGELDGTGRWELAEEPGGTTVRYAWNVRTTRPWMNALAPIGRPIFNWNHAVIMDEGGVGLARLLGARLLQNTSGASALTRPRGSTASLLSGATMGAGAALLTRLVLRRRGSRA